jgi:hypothetical protein
MDKRVHTSLQIKSLFGKELIFIRHLPALKQPVWITRAMEADEKPRDTGEG